MLYIYIHMTDIDDQPADQDSVGDPQKSPTRSEDIQHQNNYVCIYIYVYIYVYIYICI